MYRQVMTSAAFLAAAVSITLAGNSPASATPVHPSIVKTAEAGVPANSSWNVTNAFQNGANDISNNCLQMPKPGAQLVSCTFGDEYVNIHKANGYVIATPSNPAFGITGGGLHYQHGTQSRMISWLGHRQPLTRLFNGVQYTLTAGNLEQLVPSYMLVLPPPQGTYKRFIRFTNLGQFTSVCKHLDGGTWTNVPCIGLGRLHEPEGPSVYYTVDRYGAITGGTFQYGSHMPQPWKGQLIPFFNAKNEQLSHLVVTMRFRAPATTQVASARTSALPSFTAHRATSVCNRTALWHSHHINVRGFIEFNGDDAPTISLEMCYGGGWHNALNSPDLAGHWELPATDTVHFHVVKGEYFAFGQRWYASYARMWRYTWNDRVLNVNKDQPTSLIFVSFTAYAA